MIGQTIGQVAKATGIAALPGRGARPSVRMGWGLHPMWEIWGIGMMLMMLVFWVVVIVGIVLAIRWMVSQGRESRPADAALDIRRQRYARGDMGKEEFEAKKKDLA